MSDFVADGFMRERGRVPTYEELSDKAVTNLVNSLRKMLAEYEEHASNLDGCRDEDDLACKELREMDLLRRLMRIILDAFEGIYQKMQVIQYQLDKELSSKSIFNNRGEILGHFGVERFIKFIFRGN